ncbi:preprotein translocase subunit SecE [Propionibacterium cyclohexanicum]|uniref:preprotein translocase subunit SecE n=1 Tax=Propionibacterium cyclohexanicum TaxID=64702 RepID=UPI001FDF1F94|nr:preprotein translocase subunit SecE [Propionibacterium cyclohexanicum]
MADQPERSEGRDSSPDAARTKRHHSSGHPAPAADLPGSQLAGARDEPPASHVDDPEAEELAGVDEQELDDTPDSGDAEDMIVDDAERLSEAQRRAAQASTEDPEPIVRKHSTSPVRRVRPRQRGKDEDTAHRRANPVLFTKQSVAELKRVVWPTGDQLGQSFVVVLVFVLLIMAIVAGLDFGFGKLLLELLG